MTKRLETKLTKSCMRLLSTTTRKRDNCVLLLVTVDEGGCPRICLLSPYQVLATTPSDLYFGVYGGSRTERNLNHSRRATLAIPEGKGLLYANGIASFLSSKQRLQPSKRESNPEKKGNVIYHFAIDSVQIDASKAAPINSEMRFDVSMIGEEYQQTFEKLKEKVLERVKEIAML